MTELAFYKWIIEHNPEWGWRENRDQDDVIIWISPFSLESFLKLLPYSLLDDGGIEVRLQKDGIALWASDILLPLGIPIENIFEKASAVS